MPILYKKKIINNIVTLALILFIGLVPLCVLADTIYLKNNQILENVIVLSQSDEYVTIELNIGKASIKKTNIKKVEISSPSENEKLKKEWQKITEERKRKADELIRKRKAAGQDKKKQKELKKEWQKITEERKRKADESIRKLKAARQDKKKQKEQKKEAISKTKPKISIKDRRIYLNGSLYYLKGVAYGINYPECEGGMKGYKKIPFSIFEKDFEMMEKAGINTIRTYEPLPVELLDLAHKHNIMVIENIVYPNSGTRFESKEELTKFKNKAMTFAKEHKDHPAILMWSIWNDAPFTWGPGGNVVKRHGFKKTNGFLKEIYLAVKSVDKSHPITGSNMLEQEGTELGFDFLDVIGVNAYIGGHGRWRGKAKAKNTIKKLVRFSEKYDKPVVILETGYSTYIKNEVRKETQEEVLRAQIKITGENIAGIIIFQWSDGWWKAGRPTTHDQNIEEHWGIVTGYREPKSGLKAVSELFNSIPTKSKGYSSNKQDAQ